MLLIAFHMLRVEKLPLLRLKELETIAHKAVVSNDKSIMGLLIVNQESWSAREPHLTGFDISLPQNRLDWEALEWK